MKVLRERYALAPDGTVLALLGVEVVTKASGRCTLIRKGMTEATWRRGTWIRTSDLAPPEEADGAEDGDD